MENSAMAGGQAVLPADTTALKLHDLLRMAMGWHDCHPHQFFAAEGEL